MTAPVQAGPQTVRVELGSRGYDIVIGSGLIGRAGALIAPVLDRRRAIVVTDRTVAGLHLDALTRSLAEAGIEATAITLPPGEETKNFDGLRTLVEAVLDARPDRSSTLIALGGGVIGDLTGFAASIVLRGIDFVQVPTTLLAQVDSAVGGKTGIDTRHGKNMVGSFHQPRLVLADIGALATLPRRELLAGYAEVVKYGLIGDAAFFAWLEANAARIAAGDADALRYAVAKSCAAKAAVVAEDEREADRRALLNLGHTFGHALEAALGFGPALRHGEAVSIGMVMAFDLSVRLGLCPAADAARLVRHLAAVGLPTRLQEVGLPTGIGTIGRGTLRADDLIERMGHDKKVRAGVPGLVLARGIGGAFIARDVAPAELARLLEDATAT